MLDDLSLVSCSYNTPNITITMLKSWKRVNGNITNKIMIMDNSSNEETARLLHDYEVPFIRNPSSSHFEGVQLILDNVKTKYILLVDTDVIFNKNILEIYNMFKSEGYAMMGEVCGDRGGQPLYNRVHPWFCFIDVEQIRNNDIKFANFDKINRTNSNSYYGTNPLVSEVGGKKYDVGATFYEDILEKGLTIKDIKLDPEYYYHYEGMSWRGDSGVASLIQENLRNTMRYDSEYRRLLAEPIKKWFTLL